MHVVSFNSHSALSCCVKAVHRKVTEIGLAITGVGSENFHEDEDAAFERQAGVPPGGGS